MTARTIQPGEALERVWEELCFSKAALLGRVQTASLASLVDPYIERVLGLSREQWMLWQEETAAQAGVVSINYVLDETVLDISEAKLDALREQNPGWRDKQAKDSSEYEHYFPVPISAITKLQPEAQLEYMRPWKKALAGESYEPLQLLLARLEGEIKDAETALQKRDDAQSETALHRLKKIEPFIDEVNRFRTELYADLLKLSQQHKLPKTWANLFFRATQAPSASSEELRGLSRALLLLLNKRGFALTEEQQKKVAKTNDPSLFETWLTRSISAPSADVVFASTD
jgi:hypothetical protein